MSALNPGDPLCRPGLSATEEQNCRTSGSVAQRYPTSSYGIDYADPPTGISSLPPWSWFATEVGLATAVVWEVWLYGIRAVLNLINWAFALRLVQDAMRQVAQSLGTLHDQVFGVSWLEAALVVAGLWGTWNGLVKRKTIETIGGLAVTVALMIGALILIAQPQATVGKLSSYVDEASLTALSSAAQANVSQPAQGLSAAEAGLFTALVVRPWCALEFGDVGYCLTPRNGTTVADIWLAFPPMGPGRQALFNLATTGSVDQYGGIFGLGKQIVEQGLGLTQAPPASEVSEVCGKGGSRQQCAALKAAQSLSCFGKAKGTSTGSSKGSGNCAFSSGQSGKVQMQAGANALTRVVLLLLISAGLLGATCVLFYLAIHLVMAAIKTLILLLAAPVMLLVAAFGQAGRQTVISWGQRLLGAIVTKLVYAVLLALVLLTASAIDNLRINWFAVWLLSIMFWWGVFVHRREFVQFLSMDKQVREGGLDVAGHGRPFRIAGALFGGYYAMRFARDLARGVTALPRALRRRDLEHRLADSAALREGDLQEQGAWTRRAIDVERADELRDAQEVLAGHEGNVERLGELRRQRRTMRDELKRLRDEPVPRRPARQKARDEAIAGLQRDLADKDDAIKELEGRVSATEIREAERTVRRLKGPPQDASPREVAARAEQMRRDLEDERFPDWIENPEGFKRRLSGAGISYHDYWSADPAARAKLIARAVRAGDHQRELFARIDDPRARDGVPYSQRALAAGREAVRMRGDGDRFRIRSFVERQRMKAEKELARRRGRMR